MKKTVAIAVIAASLALTACETDKSAQNNPLERLIASVKPYLTLKPQGEKQGPPAPEAVAEKSKDEPKKKDAAEAKKEDKDKPEDKVVIAAEPKSEPAPGPDEPKRLIAIVIDDMGVNLKESAEALKLPAAVTMSYLPYAQGVRAQVASAKTAGHEIMLHMPMQPLRRSADPGPDYLGTKYPPEEIRARVIRNLDAFEGYAAVNNHMGSKFTQDREGMQVVMEEIKKRDVMFLDSKTINASVAEKVAIENGIPATHRDIFLDDEETNTFTEGALDKTESYARRHGSAVAIGHPKAITLRDLNEWIPRMEKKGYRFVSLTEVLKFREEQLHDKKVASLKDAAKP
jgi:polysaccharide deacetylase 2 family uncharacterized protein YibQ